MKAEFFVEDGTFYIVRTYDDDYVILYYFLLLQKVFTNLFKKYGFAWRLQIQRFLQDSSCWV